MSCFWKKKNDINLNKAYSRNSGLMEQPEGFSKVDLNADNYFNVGII